VTSALPSRDPSLAGIARFFLHAATAATAHYRQRLEHLYR
jgi:hypothetical protein